MLGFCCRISSWQFRIVIWRLVFLMLSWMFQYTMLNFIGFQKEGCSRIRYSIDTSNTESWTCYFGWVELSPAFQSGGLLFDSWLGLFHLHFNWASCGPLTPGVCQILLAATVQNAQTQQLQGACAKPSVNCFSSAGSRYWRTTLESSLKESWGGMAQSEFSAWASQVHEEHDFAYIPHQIGLGISILMLEGEA